jgi:putative DNA primase/helicase
LSDTNTHKNIEMPPVGSIDLPNPFNIPEELKSLNQWVLWKYEIDTNSKGEKRLTKIPYQITPATAGKEAKAKPNDSKTWGSFEEAYSILADSIKRKGYHGLGFVFSEHDRFVGVDIDHVFDPESEEWNDFALDEVLKLNSYAELSPSNTGAHVIVRGSKPPERCRSNNWEMYEAGRYFTFTGNHIPETPKEIREAPEALKDLYSRRINKDAGETQKKGRGRPKKNVVIKANLTDSEVIEKCRRAKNYEAFEALYNGKFDNYVSQSDADLALCRRLAFYTKSPEQIDRIFRTSGLFRSKWEREDYRADTINKAIESTPETYNPNYKKEKDKKTKIEITFDEIGDRILENHNIFTMRDNGELFIYQDGYYSNEGSESVLDTIIRDTQIEIYKEKWEEATGEDEPEKIDKATSKRVSEVLAYIRAYTYVSRSQIDIEQDGYVNFKNGLFDLKEWKLKPHTPEVRSIAQVPAVYNPTAECPNIKDYMNTCELPQEDQDVLIEFAGYCLISDVSLQRAVMLYGSGSNGKSVFINLLKVILGKSYVSGESLQNLETDKYRVANLYGKRLNAFPDLKDTPLQTNEVFNTLTGNDLELTGERKYQHSFSFRPTTKLLFSANKPPFAHSDNYAYYRRWILIKFPKTFEKEEIKERLIDDLTTEEEISGFINLMLEGLERLQKNRKFSYNAGVEEVERIYLMHSDNVRIFEEECLRDCSGNEEPTEKKRVYSLYCEWCNQNGLTPVKPNAFTMRLGKLGRRVHETTKYDIVTKRGEHISTYFNTVVDRQDWFKTKE